MEYDVAIQINTVDTNIFNRKELKAAIIHFFAGFEIFCGVPYFCKTLDSHRFF
jgi:hypothetical protein